MTNFQDIMDLAELRAIHVALEPTFDSIYRMKCREYSAKYFTPLHVVMNELDPLFVCQHLYEDKHGPRDVRYELDEFLEKLYTIKDPEYSSISKQELEELVDSVMNKEIARKSKKKPITQQMIQNDIKESKVVKSTLPTKPKSGGLNFSELNKTEPEAGEF